MMSLRTQKVFYNKLLDILQRSDSLSIEMDANLLKSKAFDRAGLVLTGVSATLAVLLEQIEIEIAQEVSKERLDKEFQKLWLEEQSRFDKRKKEIAPPAEDDEPDDLELGGKA